MPFLAVNRDRCPEISCEIDFTNDPTNPVRVWTDVTSDLRALAYVRAGRNHELQRTSAGTLTADFNNRHGWYDPTNSASPFFPGVKRRRWVRVRARWNGVIYAIWMGVVEAWQLSWPGFGKDSLVRILAADAMKVLNLFDLAGLTYAAQRTDQRTAAVCASVGLTSTVENGASSVVAVATPFDEGSSALAHLTEVEETENGIIFAEGDGTITFQSRHHRILNSATPKGVIGDQPGEIRYRDGEMHLDDADLWNKVAVTPDGGVAQIYTDATSPAQHFTSRLNRTVLSSDANEAANAAQYLVARYADPDPRIPEVELIGSLDPSTWPVILAAKNSDRFTWKRRASAHTISQDVFVEQVDGTVVPGTDWRVRMQLSPADDQSGWVLGDATYGVLGTTTRLVY